MKKFIFIICLLTFPALAANDGRLPEKYLGYWKPMSKTVADVGIDIRDHGVIYNILDGNQRYLELKAYRFIGEYPGKDLAYILIYDGSNNNPDIRVWQIRKEQYKLLSETIDGKYTLLINSKDCGLTLKSFATLSQKSLWNKVTKECQFNQDPYNEGDLDTYVRYETH